MIEEVEATEWIGLRERLVDRVIVKMRDKVTEKRWRGRGRR